MKREEIIAKWAGMTARERDAWVSVDVFGLVIEQERRPNGDVYEVEYGGARRVLPHYTTDIAAAWGIFEMNGVSSRVVNRGGEYCAELAAFRGPRGTALTVLATGRTAPEAICLAAIIASLESDGTDAKLTEVPANE